MADSEIELQARWLSKLLDNLQEPERWRTVVFRLLGCQIPKLVDSLGVRLADYELDRLASLGLEVVAQLLEIIGEIPLLMRGAQSWKTYSSASLNTLVT